MKAHRPARDGDGHRRGVRKPAGTDQRQFSQPQSRGTRPGRERRRSAPQTAPIPRPAERPTTAKSASQAKARAKARKAKAPKVVRPPLRERLIARLATIDLNPRTLVARVPFVVLVIGSLGVGLGLTLWLSTDAAERSYQLGEARETNQALLQQKEALERDVLEAQAAPALAEAARTLGMIPSRDTAHLVQDPAGNWIVVGTPKPAEGAPPPPLNTPLPDETPPTPPPTPRVVEPREVMVRVPASGVPTPAAPGAEVPVPAAEPPAVPMVAAPETPHGVAGQPPALGPAEPPVDPALVPAVEPPPVPPAEPLSGPPHIDPAQPPAQPGAPIIAEQFGPVPGAPT
jgi:hypothetical protein